VGREWLLISPKLPTASGFGSRKDWQWVEEGWAKCISHLEQQLFWAPKLKKQGACLQGPGREGAESWGRWRWRLPGLRAGGPSPRKVISICWLLGAVPLKPPATTVPPPQANPRQEQDTLVAPSATHLWDRSGATFSHIKCPPPGRLWGQCHAHLCLSSLMPGLLGVPVCIWHLSVQSWELNAGEKWPGRDRADSTVQFPSSSHPSPCPYAFRTVDPRQSLRAPSIFIWDLPCNQHCLESGNKPGTSGSCL
jgi:hypothetical protein